MTKIVQTRLRFLMITVLLIKMKKIKIIFKEINIFNLLNFKFYFILVLSTISFNLLSQTKAKVNYIVTPTGGTFENNVDIKKSEIADRFIGIDEAFKSLNYVLLIQDSISYYYLMPNLKSSERVYRTASNIASSSEYFKVNNNEYIQKSNIFGENLNVLHKINKNWNLTSETKIINNYLCYKAISERVTVTKDKSITVNIIAWYCPAIAFQNGPKGFGGLPGLILELQDGRITYLANKINIDKNLKIELKKAEGKITTEEEAKEKIQEFISDLEKKAK